MKASIQQKKAEAIERMKMLKLYPGIIREFEEKNILNYSEIIGILFWVSQKPEWLEKIRSVEKEYNILVYHAELSRLEEFELLTLFYVSDHPKEWDADRKRLQKGYAYGYIINLTDDMCSEFGSIAFRSVNGGVKRTA